MQMRIAMRSAVALVGAIGLLLIAGWGASRLKGEARSGIRPEKSEIANTKSLLDTFQLNCGRFPTTEEGLQALQIAPKDLEKRWKGPYGSPGVGNDSWGNPFQYTSSGPDQFELISFGADGRPGGVGDDEDLTVNE